MKSRIGKDWEKFQKESLEMTVENVHKVKYLFYNCINN